MPVPKRPISIVVIDDHQLFRTGMIELLNTVVTFTVIGDGSSGADAVRLARERKPDVLTLDVEVGDSIATDTIRQIVECSPQTKVVIVTMHDDPDLVRSLLKAGAAGYVHKSAGRSELVAMISTAAADGGLVMLAVSRATILALTRKPHPDQQLLSSRELEILTLVSAACSNRAIASKLFISEGTVKRHLANAYAKLGASSRLEAIRRAAALGLIEGQLQSGRILNQSSDG